MAVTVGAFLLGQTVATAGASYFLQWTVGYLATTALTSTVLNALAPKPSFQSAGSTGYQVASKSAAADHQVVYGKTRVGGIVVFDATSGTDNKFLHRVIAVAGHEVEDIEHVYFNDEQITSTSSTNVYLLSIDVGANSNLKIYSSTSYSVGASISYSSLQADAVNTEENRNALAEWGALIGFGGVSSTGTVDAVDQFSDIDADSQYSGYVTIEKYTGTDDQTASTALVNAGVGWTANHRLRGVAYVYVKMRYNSDVFVNGVPDISFLVKGKKVYDPRTGTTAWSDNPALCIRDYLTSDYGLAESTSRIDDELVKTAANVCEYLNYPTLSGGDRFTLNGNFVTSVTPHDILTDMLTSMGGLLWYSQGKWRMKPAYYTASVLDLNEDDLRSSISVATRHSRRNNFNEVKGTFRGADTNYQPTDYNPVFNITDADGGLTVGQPYAIHELGNTNWNTVAGTSGVTYAVGDVFVAATIGTGTGKANYWLGVDGGDKSTIDLNLPFTDDFDIARRIARIMLERNRQQLTVQAKFGMRAFQVQVGDTVRITNSRFGWTNKEFEVVNWSFGLADDKDLQTDLTLREISSNVFDDVDDGAVLEVDNTTLESPFAVQAPSLDAPVVTTDVNEDGTTVPSISFAWSVTNPQLVEYYEFQYKLTSASTYNTRIVKDGEYTLAPALSGSAYNYRVRAVNQLGVKGAFVSGASTASTGNDATTPNAPTNVSVSASYQAALVTWDAPTTNTDSSALKDLFQYKIYRGTSDNPTTLVGRVSGETFSDSGLNDGQTYYYRVKAIDFTGNESEYSASGNGTTNAALVDGVNSASVFLYQKNTSPTTAPADPSGTFTYTFATGVLSGGTLNGWSQTPPSLSEGDYMWAITATAANRNATDSIPASEFSDAIVFTESAEAYRAATVTLYKKNTSGTTAPADPSGTFTYTFATAALSGGTLDGWSQSAPSLDKGEYLWVIQATAFNNATTDSIAASEFSTAVVGGIGGEDGSTGASTNIIFQRSASAPTTPSASAGVPTDWYDSPPSGTELLWASSGVKSVGATNFTWGTPFRIEGEAVAEVSIYRKNSNAGASGGSYNFTTNTLTPPTNWSINPPALTTNGDIIYRATGITTGAATATAATVTYGTAVVYAQRVDGQDGQDGVGSDGARGAGRWHIGVTSLPTTSSGADTDFTNAIGDPVDLDQAFFYTGTLANPTAQGIWIYDESTDSWDEQVEYFDGGLLIDGTVTADHLSASSISALGLTIGTLSSAASGARLELKDDRIQVYDSGGTVRVKIGNLS